MAKRKKKEFITINDISDEQWKFMKELAMKMHTDGHLDKDLFKCTVSAFCYWIADQPVQFAVDYEEKSDMH